VESRENREYGEFSWRLLGELEPFLRIFSFLMRAPKVEGDDPSLTAVPFGPDIRPRVSAGAKIPIMPVEKSPAPGGWC
jgi:hypothetical protein